MYCLTRGRKVSGEKKSEEPSICNYTSARMAAFDSTQLAMQLVSQLTHRAAFSEQARPIRAIHQVSSIINLSHGNALQD